MEVLAAFAWLYLVMGLLTALVGALFDWLSRKLLPDDPYETVEEIASRFGLTSAALWVGMVVFWPKAWVSAYQHWKNR